jgi:hypothetical protein
LIGLGKPGGFRGVTSRLSILPKKDLCIMAIKKLTEGQDFIRRVVTASKLPKAKATKLAVELWNMGPRSARLAENACNRELTPREEKRDEQMDARVVAIGEELGLRAYRQGDPRGHTIRVVVGKALANNWDGETTGCG